METKETKKLLERFYNGLTDETEEKRVAEYFCSNEVDEELREEAEMFLALQQNAAIEVPFDLESKIERQGRLALGGRHCSQYIDIAGGRYLCR